MNFLKKKYYLNINTRKYIPLEERGVTRLDVHFANRWSVFIRNGNYFRPKGSKI